MALVIVMIAIAVLSIMAAAFAFSMKVETKLAQNASSETELTWMGLSGVEFARWVLVQQTTIPDERGFDALNQFWASGDTSSVSNSPFEGMSLSGFPLGNGHFSVKIVDLERRMNINSADLRFLQNAFNVVGVDAGESSQITSAIMDWIDADDNRGPNGAEDDDYMALDPPYHCKNKPIDDLAELLLIRGVTQDMFWGGVATNHPPSKFQTRLGARQGYADQTVFPVGLRDIFTPFSNGKININTASPEVLQMIPLMDENTAAEIIRLRSETPFRNISQLASAGMNPQLFQQISQYLSVQSSTFEVQVDAEVAGYHRHFTAIVGRNPRNPRDVPVLTFSWK
jgi:general secretion pathway protein K